MKNNYIHRECAICIESTDLMPQKTKLQCGHEFHTKCIRNWQKQKQSCPLCITNLINQWNTKCKLQLKEKVYNRVTKRAMNAQQCINHSIRTIIHNTRSNHIWISITKKDIHKYDSVVPSFKLSTPFIKKSINELYKKIDQWNGIEIDDIEKQPQKFKNSYKKIESWWMRYKSQWIGDYFIYPLLQNTLFKYIINLTSVVSSNDKMFTQELLYFSVLRNLIHSSVVFNRARPQPLISLQSYTKSERLKQFFMCVGHQHSFQWMPNNINGNRNRLNISDYVQQWSDQMLKLKQIIYKNKVMHMQNKNNRTTELQLLNAENQRLKAELQHIRQQIACHQQRQIQSVEPVQSMQRTLLLLLASMVTGDVKMNK
eukprot:525103_1